VQQIVEQQHQLSGAAAEELAGGILGSLALGTRLKGPGLLSVQRDHEGPFAGWRVEAMGLGYVRAMVPGAVHEAFAAEAHLNDAGPEDGTLRVTRQMADGGQPYKTILAAPAVPINELLNMHLIASEQVPARLLTDVERAVAVYVERFPGGETDWEPWESLSAVDAPVRDLSAEDNRALATAIVGGDDWRELRDYPVKFHCPCKRERYLNTLRGFGADQLRDLSDGHGMVNAVCDFCRKRFEFALDDLI
jgi:molecular chaperone Hsp33